MIGAMAAGIVTADLRHKSRLRSEHLVEMSISAIALQHARLVLRPLGQGSRDMDVIWTAMGMARPASSQIQNQPALVR